ncbi:MAG: L,D-transpeptidase catalytic domain [Alphaproteobacteria bacterium ADurb.Bin438]|nr:MAG: L,D-transpeptidase catalytic domain [Alphaproteobacteria bacterium ADurb.Bin438]
MKYVLIVLCFILFLIIGYNSYLVLKKSDIKIYDNVEKIVVYKSLRQLSLVDKDDKALKTYKIALGFNPKGHKQREGDGKTPEGVYEIDYRQFSRRYYKSLHISYPNEQDKEVAKSKNVSPGGFIMIHGLGKIFAFMKGVHKNFDWTLGCIALDNEEIDEIWANVKDGIKIEIKE